VQITDLVGEVRGQEFRTTLLREDEEAATVTYRVDWVGTSATTEVEGAFPHTTDQLITAGEFGAKTLMGSISGPAIVDHLTTVRKETEGFRSSVAGLAALFGSTALRLREIYDVKDLTGQGVILALESVQEYLDPGSAEKAREAARSEEESSADDRDSEVDVTADDSSESMIDLDFDTGELSQ
jgi:hypothetical protein